VTLRDETEWVETVEAWWNQVVGADADRICEAVERAGIGCSIPEYGEGYASEAIVAAVLRYNP
jgi:UDP-N-acetylglucosamine 2-epimerase